MTKTEAKKQVHDLLNEAAMQKEYGQRYDGRRFKPGAFDWNVLRDRLVSLVDQIDGQSTPIARPPRTPKRVDQ